MKWSHSPKSEYWKSLIPSVRQRILCEKAIARAITLVALEKGYLVSVNDGEETVLTNSKIATQVMKALHTTDEDYLTIYDPATKRTIGAFKLIYGNSGYDVVNDYYYGLNTKSIMDALNAVGSRVADKWEKKLTKK